MIQSPLEKPHDLNKMRKTAVEIRGLWGELPARDQYRKGPWEP